MMTDHNNNVDDLTLVHQGTKIRDHACLYVVYTSKYHTQKPCNS